MIVYRISDGEYMMVVNAANIAKDRAHVVAHLNEDVALDDRSYATALVAIQGPRAADILAAQTDADVGSLPSFGVTHGRVAGARATLARTGYTGEDGFEVFVGNADAPRVWDGLLAAGRDHGIKPIGLGARDTLRLEMGYPLHGQDIGEDRTPLEAGAAWAVGTEKGDFIGRAALAEQRARGIPARLWGLRMNEPGRIPRPHYPVLAGGRTVGETTSGTFSPSLRIGIAMAYLSPRDAFSAGDVAEVDIRGRRAEAQLVRPPFVDSSPK